MLLVMMKKMLMLILGIFLVSTYGFSATFERVLGTDNLTPTPEGCSKIVFHQYNQCSKIPFVVVENAKGEQFTIESNGYGGAPYMYFIPNGEYTIISMVNMEYWNTACGTLIEGCKFSAKSLGYITFTAVEEKKEVHSFPKIVATDNVTKTPEGTCKTVFATGESTVMIVEDSNRNRWRFDGSVPPYFYFINPGVYKVITMVGMNGCCSLFGTIREGNSFTVALSQSSGYFSSPF